MITKGNTRLTLRRAYQTLCLFYGADPQEFGKHVKFAQFLEYDLAECSDTGPDQMESWNSVVDQIRNKESTSAFGVEVIYGEGPMKTAMKEAAVLERVADIARTFPWPNGNITPHFDHCDFGASWNRTSRTILLCDDYVARFVRQAAVLGE